MIGSLVEVRFAGISRPHGRLLRLPEVEDPAATADRIGDHDRSDDTEAGRGVAMQSELQRNAGGRHRRWDNQRNASDQRGLHAPEAVRADPVPHLAVGATDLF